MDFLISSKLKGNTYIQAKVNIIFLTNFSEKTLTKMKTSWKK